jgi:hypothetical protein
MGQRGRCGYALPATGGAAVLACSVFTRRVQSSTAAVPITALGGSAELAARAPSFRATGAEEHPEPRFEVSLITCAHRRPSAAARAVIDLVLATRAA